MARKMIGESEKRGKRISELNNDLTTVYLVYVKTNLKKPRH